MQSYTLDLDTILHILARSQQSGLLSARLKRLPRTKAPGQASLSLREGRVLSCEIKDQTGIVLFSEEEALRHLRNYGKLDWQWSVQQIKQAPQPIRQPTQPIRQAPRVTRNTTPLSPSIRQMGRTTEDLPFEQFSPNYQPGGAQRLRQSGALNSGNSLAGITPWPSSLARQQSILTVVPWRNPQRARSTPLPTLSILQNSVLALVNNLHTIEQIFTFLSPIRREDTLKALRDLQALGLIILPGLEEYTGS